MLEDPTFRASQDERKATLARLRQAIEDAPLAPPFAAALAAAYEKLVAADGGATPGVFVRSSTNAEDLPGFSGAGLYDTVPNVRGIANVGRAVKKVGKRLESRCVRGA